MLGKKEKLIIKIIIAVLLAIAVTFSVIVFIYIQRTDVPYWINHFGFALILIPISGIAMLLPMLNQSKYVGDGKGDSLMVIVSILLFLSALLSIGLSYLIK
jgi:hypothetical protein